MPTNIKSKTEVSHCISSFEKILLLKIIRYSYQFFYFTFFSIVLHQLLYQQISLFCSFLELHPILPEKYFCRNFSFFNPIQHRGRQKAPPPFQFFPFNFYKRENQPPRLSNFQFQPFYHTSVKFEVHNQCQFQIIELEPRLHLKKILQSNSYKIEFMITFLIEMLQLPNFGHKTTSII